MRNSVVLSRHTTRRMKRFEPVLDMRASHSQTLLSHFSSTNIDDVVYVSKNDPLSPCRRLSTDACSGASTLVWLAIYACYAPRSSRYSFTPRKVVHHHAQMRSIQLATSHIVLALYSGSSEDVPFSCCSSVQGFKSADMASSCSCRPGSAEPQ